MAEKKSNRGGVRPGAGRKKDSGAGRMATSTSISFHPAVLEALDKARGDMSRGEWIKGDPRIAEGLAALA